VSAWDAVTFRAMGSSCRIVAPDRTLAELGRRLVDDLEARWSRFLPSSEISALNQQSGRLSVVSVETYELIDCAQRARDATGDRFNPLMLDQLCALGYDRTWEHVDVGGDSIDERAGAARFQLPSPPTDAPIEMFPQISAIRLPEGARFDPGGIGKGLAGDMVARALQAAGATSAQVELGGDVKVAGPEWAGGAWRVRVDADHVGLIDRNSSERGDDPQDTTAATIALAEGGVATSSVMSKRWRRSGSTMHHLLDSRTGRPADTDLESVTAVAPALWWAEVVAKVALMSGSSGARSVMEGFGVSGVLVAADRNRRYDVVSSSVGPIGGSA
jgi:FAD:protein FMN transferase